MRRQESGATGHFVSYFFTLVVFEDNQIGSEHWLIEVGPLHPPEPKTHFHFSMR